MLLLARSASASCFKETLVKSESAGVGKRAARNT